ncbi:hypothetical protein, partial [Aeromonas sp. QDB05]|uniref:hypothetical protein n=2 Tax=Aeromonas TaxID=642 RepID=UPI0022E7C765
MYNNNFGGNLLILCCNRGLLTPGVAKEIGGYQAKDAEQDDFVQAAQRPRSWHDGLSLLHRPQELHPISTDQHISCKMAGMADGQEFPCFRRQEISEPILNAKGDSLRRRWEGNFAGASAPLV